MLTQCATVALSAAEHQARWRVEKNRNSSYALIYQGVSVIESAVISQAAYYIKHPPEFGDISASEHQGNAITHCQLNWQPATGGCYGKTETSKALSS